MICDLYIKYLFDGLFDGLDPWIAEFHDLTRIRQDHMVMLAIKIRFFVLCLIFAKLVFSNQFAFQ